MKTKKKVNQRDLKAAVATIEELLKQHANKLDMIEIRLNAITDAMDEDTYKMYIKFIAGLALGARRSYRP
jgi:uncharacterized protein HemY